MPSTLPSSIPDSQLGLSQSELHILRQHQQIALSAGNSTAAPHYAHSTSSSRGRGHVRTSASTSRAASAASSGPGGGGRLLLDAGSLAVLGSHFERLMGAIQNRVNHVRIAGLFQIRGAAVSFFALMMTPCYALGRSVIACSCFPSLQRKLKAPPSISHLALNPQSPPLTPKSLASETFCARSTISRLNSIRCAISVTLLKAFEQEWRAWREG